MTLPTARPAIDGPAASEPAEPFRRFKLPARFNVVMRTAGEREREAAAAARRRLDNNGRPSAYSAEIAARILDGLADGRTLLDVCDEEGLPAPRTVHCWVLEDREGFAARYFQAREIGCHVLADEILVIADHSRNDWVMRRIEDGTPEGVIEIFFDHEHVRRSRLRMEARQWRLSKFMPRIYGEKPDPNAKPAEDDGWAALLKEIDGKNRGLLPKDDLIMTPTGEWVRADSETGKKLRSGWGSGNE